MSKKYISFLGTNDYLECKYKFENKTGSVVKYVQEDLINRICSGWNKGDEIIIFVTNEAKQKNWFDNGHTNKNTGKIKENIGLKNRIKKLGLKCNVQSIDIPIGNDEKELWNIFEIIFNTFKNEEKIYFDVTHSFRSLPIFTIVLLNYAKFLKNIEIKKILYGAFETLGAISEIIKKEPQDRIAPIFDLTSVALLQNWTDAISSYMNYGITEEISILVNSEIKPLLAESKGTDAKANLLRNFSNKINAIDSIQSVCRSKDIIEFEFNDFFEDIKKLKNTNFIKPLTALFDKVKSKIERYQDYSLRNCLISTEICYDNKKYQQAITFLQEFINSYLLYKMKWDIFIQSNRDSLNSAVRIISEKIPKSKWQGDINKIGKIIDNLNKINNINKWIKIYNTITDYRNDINHAGLLNDSSKANIIIKKIKYFIDEIKKIIDDNDNLDMKNKYNIIIANSFTPAMLEPGNKDVAVSFKIINEKDIKKIVKNPYYNVESVIGHESTAQLFSEKLGIKLDVNRKKYLFNENDIVIAGVIKSQDRIKEGKVYNIKEMKNKDIVWYKITKYN